METLTLAMSIDPRQFRNALGRFATGITVVTVLDGDQIRGITVNAFMSVSLEPPLVLVSIDKGARTHALLARSDRYGISILNKDQEALSNHFAGRKVDELEVQYVYADGFPLVKGALAQLVCRVVEAHDAGDHTLFIGQVEHLSYGDDGPLLYFAGRYGRLEVPEGDPILDG